MAALKSTSSEGSAVRADFERVASEIQRLNETPAPVFRTLKSVAKKLLRDDIRYRILETTGPKVLERLIGFEAVMDFLVLLGFEIDVLGRKLQCRRKPAESLVRVALEVLQQFETAAEMESAIIAEDETGDGMSDDLPLTEAITTTLRPNDEVPSDVMTVRRILAWTTFEKGADDDAIDALVLTHSQFTTSLTLFQELRSRFFVRIPADICEPAAVELFTKSVMKPMQLKVVKCLRKWMKNYWELDFETNEELKAELRQWLSEMREMAKVYSWCELLAKYVRADMEKYHEHGSGRYLEPAVDYSSVLIPRKFSIHSLSGNQLADQISVMGFRLFTRVHPRECLGQVWTKEECSAKAPNILAMIAHCSDLTKFVQMLILREKSFSARGKTLTKVITMAERFFELHNYNSLFAVTSALSSAPIRRLKRAWERVAPRKKAQLDECSAVFCVEDNYGILRQKLCEALDFPCIPCFDVFLQDLVRIDQSEDDETKEDSLDERMMAKFRKQMRVWKCIKEFQGFQRFPFATIEEESAAQKLLAEEFQKLKDISEDVIWDMSTEVKRRDERSTIPDGF